MGKTFSALEVKAMLKTPGRYCLGGGLWLFVTKEGRGAWIYRYMLRRVQHDMGLGPASFEKGDGKVTLADARKAAFDAFELKRQGIDPMEARQEAKKQARIVAAKTVTFQACADAYLSKFEGKWRNDKHRQQWRNTLSAYVHPLIGSIPVQEIGKDEIVKVLEQQVAATSTKPAGVLWSARPETASRVRARIETVLDFAKAKDWREGDNPASWNLIKFLMPDNAPEIGVDRRHKHMPQKDVPQFMGDLEQQGGIAALALRFLILTGSRTAPVTGAVWSEIDRENAIWRVPAARMKAKKDHWVSLSQQALAVLDEISTDTGIIFRQNHLKPGLSNGGMDALLKRMGKKPLTVHGFRSSFKSWVDENRPDDRIAAERVLAHAVGNAVEQAYSRYDAVDRDRALMQAWADFVSPRNAEIIPIKQAG